MSDPPQQRKSLVDYSKVVDRPAQDARFAAQSQQRHKGPDPPPSAQMDAVIRLMTGREERTIAEKLADANRPTWEQYKKDNHDKLNLDEANDEEMELYRRKLDEQRDRLLARKSGSSSKPKKKKKKKKRRRRDESSDESSSDDSSESEDEGDNKRHKKKHKRKHKKRKHKHRDSSSSSESDDSSRKRRKKHDKRPKDPSKESDDNHYKLSQFFSEGNENNS